ncbi:unnamed protein product [Durusdinium trenchii]|uniref:N-acetyltransferase domain-containing protein n=1 Tax=Durusdinium trenchii TaxID=1381693 RepID=A0ABP0N0P0_9DINO
MLRQADFNFIVVQLAVLGFLLWWYFAPIKKWALVRYRIARAAYLKVHSRKRQLEEKQEQQHVEDSEEKQAVESAEYVAGQSARQRGKKSKATKLQELSAARLLDAVISSDSDASSEPEEDCHKCQQDPVQEVQNRGATGSLLSRSAEVTIMHELRPGKADQSVLKAITSISMDLFQCDVWELISKKNRLKVSACLRWTGSDWKAVGLALYRVQHMLQVVYVGVEPEYRRQHVGRALVKALKELGRKDLNCTGVVAVVNKHDFPEAVTFFRAIGFKKEELKGDPNKVGLRMEIRRQGKRKSEGSGASQGTCFPLENFLCD